MVIGKRIAISASPELIWDVIMDLRRAKEWAPGFEDYPFISEEWPTAGSTAVWRYHSGPMHFDFNLRLTKSERGRIAEIVNKSVFGVGREVYRFEPTSDQTTIEYEASSQPNLLGRLFA